MKKLLLLLIFCSFSATAQVWDCGDGCYVFKTPWLRYDANCFNCDELDNSNAVFAVNVPVSNPYNASACSVVDYTYEGYVYLHGIAPLRTFGTFCTSEPIGTYWMKVNGIWEERIILPCVIGEDGNKGLKGKKL